MFLVSVLSPSFDPLSYIQKPLPGVAHIVIGGWCDDDATVVTTHSKYPNANIIAVIVALVGGD